MASLDGCDLSTTVGEVSFDSPLLAASGTFGYAREFEGFDVLACFAGVIGKTITPAPRAGNPPPRIVETAAGMLNTIGLQNPGVEAFCRDYLPYLRQACPRVIVNVGGETPREFAQVIARVEAEGAVAAYEVNLSCPNVHRAGFNPACDPQSTAEVLAACRDVTQRPLWAKISPNVTDVGAIAVAAVKAGAQAITAVNSVLGAAIDWRERRSRLSRPFAGLSGPAIKPIALRCVMQVRRGLQGAGLRASIIGVGGVSSAEDVMEFLVAGAGAVQLGTINFRRPQAAREILQALPDLYRQAQVGSTAELIGSLRDEDFAPAS